MQNVDRTLIDYYEQVRRRWCGQGSVGEDRRAIAVLLQRGMHAWMRQQAQLEPARLRSSEPSDCAGAPPVTERTGIQQERCAEVAQLLASMVMASAQQERA